MSLKNPKKIHENADFAIFKGSDGHELKILKKGLSEKLRKELASLPIHAAEGDYVQKPEEFEPGKDYSKSPMPGEKQYSGEVSATPSPPEPTKGSAAYRVGKLIKEKGVEPVVQAVKDTAGAYGKIAGAGKDVAEGMGLISPKEETIAPTPTRQEASQPEPSITPEAPPPAAEPQQQPPQPVAATTQKPQQQEAPKTVGQEISGETAAFANDITAGVIQPKTYSELFADKSTLGKIGSLFGMLLAGAGSGLTKQPNVLLEMMNKEIDRDLEAQKKNVENKRTYYQLNLEHQLRKTQMKRTSAEAGLVGEQARLAGAEADMKRAQIKAWADTQIQPRVATAHYLQTQVDKMPPGPQKVAGQQAVDSVKSEVAAFSQGVIQRAEQMAAVDLEAQFQQRQKSLMSSGLLGMPGGAAIAQDEASKHVPGFGDASIPVPTDTRKQLTGGLAFEKAARDYVNFAREHQANFIKYLKDPVKAASIAKQGAVKAANLTAAYREATNGGVFKAGEQDFINKIIPEQPASWKAFFNQIPAVEESMKDMRMKMENTAGSVHLEAPVYYKGHYYQKGPNGQAVKVK